MNTETADRYRSFAPWARESSPRYAEWALGIADDDELTERIAALGHRRGQPNLVFAAARWAGCGLDAFPVWRERALASWERIAGTTAERRTQTNEVGRCATLLPALARIPGPLALLETGTAGGLCLYPDRHDYVYSTPTGERHLSGAGTAGAASDATSLRCRVDDAGAIPDALPEVVWRAGIDLAPIDVRDPDEVAWLETLIWPGPAHDERIARLRTGVAVAQADPPRIVAGDILDRLTGLASETPREATLVVFHSAVLLYLDAAERRRFADLVSDLGARIDRRVVWLANESPGTLPSIDERMPPGLDTTGRFIQTVDGVPVALAGQHGATYETRPLRS